MNTFAWLRPVSLVACAILLASCSVLGASDREVTGRVDPPELVLTNQTGHTAYYIAIEKGSAALMDLRLENYRDWPAIRPGETVRVPVETVAYYEQGDPAIWVYWRTDQSDGTFTLRVP